MKSAGGEFSQLGFALLRRCWIRWCEIRERIGGWDGRLSKAVADGCTVSGIDQHRVEAVHVVVVQPPTTTGRGLSAGKQGALDLQTSTVHERLREVDDKEVMQQELGQWVTAIRRHRPVDRAVETVEESQVRVEPGTVGAQVLSPQVEGVLVVVQVANPEIGVDGVEFLHSQHAVLDLGASHSLQTYRAVSHRQGLCDNRKHRGRAEHLDSVDLQDQAKYILLGQSVIADFLERKPTRLDRLAKRVDVEKERIGTESGEDARPNLECRSGR